MRNLIKAGLRHLTARPQRANVGNHSAVVIAVAAQKGGVGKTTTSVSLASALARYHDKKVLLVDLDPQGHVSTAVQSQVRPGGGKLSTVLTDERDDQEVMDICTSTAIRNLWVTPYDAGLEHAEDMLSSRIGKEFVLRDALQVSRTHFDVIVLDCPPNLGTLTINGLVASDQVLIPCDPSPLALNGVEALVRTVATVASRLNPEIDVLGILLTRVDGRNTTLNEAVTTRIHESWGDALLPVHIGINSSLGKAQMDGRDIFAYDRTSRGAENYRELADWVAEHLLGVTAECHASLTG